MKIQEQKAIIFAYNDPSDIILVCVIGRRAKDKTRRVKKKDDKKI